MNNKHNQRNYYAFGPHKLDMTQIFFETNLCYASVNLKPVVPGHILVISKRIVQRVNDLTSEELCDMWLSAKTISNMLEKYHTASALTFGIQDGVTAGQTVPHVHIHVMPRKEGDFKHNDMIYERMENIHFDETCKPRNIDEMAKEASIYRELLIKK